MSRGRDGRGGLPTTAIVLRSLALQASWNTRRMQNVGLLASLQPWARRRGLAPAEVRRLGRQHFGYFNTNPYLANYLVGGLLRLEDEHRRTGGGADRIGPFKDTLGRALASLGDQLFWLGLQPAVMLVGAMGAVAGEPAAVLLPVLAFAVGQLLLRARAVGEGYRLGIDIVELLSSPSWHRAIHGLKRAGAVLTGILAAWLVHVAGHEAAGGGGWGPAVGLVVVSGIAQRVHRRLPGEVLLLLLLPLALALSYL